MINRRRFLASVGVSVMAGSVTAMPLTNNATRQAQQLSGRAFGTTWQLTLSPDSPLRDVMDACYQSIERINRALSPWHNHSEISRFNASESTGWVSVSSTCGTVISTALNIAKQSKGYFDPTVGAIVGRAGFGPILSPVERADYTQVDARLNMLRKSVPSLTLDPCGIAKGYALDLIADKLRNLDVSNYFLEIGGEIRASGLHPSGRDWVAGIESPNSGDSEPVYRVNISNSALATSSHKHNSYQTADRMVSHIVDPSIEASADSALLSVSVVADTAMVADGWATALMAAGEKQAWNLANENGVSALLMMRTTSHTLESLSVAGFDKHIL